MCKRALAQHNIGYSLSHEVKAKALSRLKKFYRSPNDVLKWTFRSHLWVAVFLAALYACQSPGTLDQTPFTHEAWPCCTIYPLAAMAEPVGNVKTVILKGIAAL
jgi:predicted enzyme related to lactoylglutathione lyase